MAGIYIEHDPTYKIIVRLKGGQPVQNFRAKVQSTLPSFINIDLSIPIEFQTGANETLDEGLSRLKANIPSLKKIFPDLQATWYDEKSGEIGLLVYTDGSLNKSILQQKLATLSSKNNGLPFNIEFTNQKMSDAASIRGGAYISSPSSYCTSGFGIKNSAGTRFITTAGHCDNNLKDMDSGVALNFVNEARNANQDVQWHSVTSGNTVVPEFYADSQTTPRTLTGRRTRASTTQGDNVCHQGKTTGYSCGYVAQTNYAPTYSNACNGQTCNPVWVRVKGTASGTGNGTLKCYQGDSGGPVFASQTAFGLLKGTLASGTGSGECTEYYYMSTDELYNLGFSLVY
ncbi:S1 family peptidase [Acinetobacter colistiniresistens]|uniref:S1 family peptidase n=1 Tax=Acinetobacter colistiniresistens TaxID=280145 RepID=UPI00208FEB08|nr:S1 family peptidase [Acinetobacter colistiniresistens]